jgi:hypothetical protein
MKELVVAERATQWHRLKALVLDSVSFPITRRVYNLGLDEFIAWFTLEPRPAGFTKATVTAWRVALEARRLGPISINVRITAARWVNCHPQRSLSVTKTSFVNGSLITFAILFA